MSKIKVFISYCHRDANFLDRTSLYAFLEDLKQDGVEFLVDRDLRGGDEWEAKLDQWMDEADVALLLISQAYLISNFCMKKEVPRLLERREKDGIRIFPILLSPCRYQTQKWLCRLQFLPSDNMTLEDYEKSAERKKQYLRITEELRQVIATIREERESTLPSAPKVSAKAKDVSTSPDVEVPSVPEALAQDALVQATLVQAALVQDVPAAEPSAQAPPASPRPSQRVREEDAVTLPVGFKLPVPPVQNPNAATSCGNPSLDSAGEGQPRLNRPAVLPSTTSSTVSVSPSGLNPTDNSTARSENDEDLLDLFLEAQESSSFLTVGRVRWTLGLAVVLSAMLFVLPSLSWFERPAHRGGILELPESGRLRVLILPWRDPSAAPAIQEWKRALPTLLRVELQEADDLRLLPERLGEEFAKSWNATGWDGELDAGLLSDLRTQTGAHVVLTGEFTNRSAIEEAEIEVELWSTGSGQLISLEANLPDPNEPIEELSHLARNVADTLEVDLQTPVVQARDAKKVSALDDPGDEFLSQLDGRAALHHFESMLKHRPEDPRLLVGQAEALALLGYETQARDLTYEVVDRLVGTAGVERSLILSRVFELRRLFRAAAWLAVASGLEVGPPTLESGLRHAMLQVRGGLLGEAARTLQDLPALVESPMPDARLARVRAELERRLAQDSQAQIEAAEQALDAADAQGVAGLFLAARAHQLAGWALNADGQIEPARQRFEAAQAIYQQQEHLRGQADVLLDLAVLLTRQSEYQRARYLYSEAQNLYDQLDNPLMMSRILLAMGYLRILEGTPGLALETFHRAAERAREAGDLVVEAHAWLGQAELLAIDGDFRAADDAYHIGQQILAAGGEQRFQSLALLMRGRLRSLEGRLGDARRAFEEAYRTSGESGDRSMQARAAGFLGRALYEYGQLERARAFYDEGLETFDRSTAEYAELLVASADTLLAGGHLDLAEKNYQLALETQQQLGIRPDSALARAGLAKLRLYSGAPAHGVEQARLAWTELRDSEHWLAAATVGGYLARALVKNGEIDEAEKILDQSGEWIAGVESLPVDLSLAMARAELSMNSARVSDTSLDARRDLEQGIARAEELGYRLLALEGRLLLLALQSDGTAPDRFRLDGIELEAEAMGFHLLVRQVQALKQRLGTESVASAMAFGT